MGMNLRQQTEQTVAASSQAWLGSAHGTTATESITVDAATFEATFADGRVPSGVFVSERADGLYVYGNAGDGDRAGHAFEGFRFTPGATGADAQVPIALFRHGKVLVDELPAGHGLVAAGADRNPHIDYVGAVPA